MSARATRVGIAATSRSINAASGRNAFFLMEWLQVLRSVWVEEMSIAAGQVDGPLEPIAASL